jgi:3-hydroxybutyryl-CoA dehydrogenase
MSLDASRPDLTLAVIGAGVMGRGIAQIAAHGGARVLLYDSRPGAAREAKDEVTKQFARLAEKGRMSAPEAEKASGNLAVIESLGALSPCHVVVEAIAENLDAKRELFRALEAIVPQDCLLASNTSSLSITAIAHACKRPERVGGFHFFNPVPLMKVVEVVDGVLTAPWVGEALIALPCAAVTSRYARKTRRASSSITRPRLRHEALRILGEGIEFHAVDRILRDCAGFRLGPSSCSISPAWMSHPVMESIYRQYYEEPRYRPSPITGQR